MNIARSVFMKNMTSIERFVGFVVAHGKNLGERLLKVSGSNYMRW